MTKLYLSWDTVSKASEQLAHNLYNQFPGESKNDIVVFAPYYGGWPVASMIINQLRSLFNDEHYKPAILSETDMTMHLLVPFLKSKHLVIIDDVLDTGRVINNIIWRIVSECRAFMTQEEILQRIHICTVGKKRDCEWKCNHFYVHEWDPNEWICYPWET